MRKHIHRVAQATFLLATTAIPSLVQAADSANGLLVEAIQYWNLSEEAEGNWRESAETRLEQLTKADHVLQRIINEFEDDELALRLMIGESFGPISTEKVAAAKKRAELDFSLATCSNSPDFGCFIEASFILNNQLKPEDREYNSKFISEAQAIAGFFDEAVNTASVIGDEQLRQRALSEISKLLAEEGHFDRALNIATEISDHESSLDALGHIAIELSERGDIEYARSIREKIKSEHNREAISLAIISYLSSQEEYDKALKAIEELQGYRKSSELASLSTRLVQSGKIEEAEEVIKMIPHWGLSCRALASFAVEIESHSMIDSFVKFARGAEEQTDREQCLREIGIVADLPELRAEARSMLAEDDSLGVAIAINAEVEAGLYDDAISTAKVSKNASSELLRIARHAPKGLRIDIVRRILPDVMRHDRVEALGILYSAEGDQSYVNEILDIAAADREYEFSRPSAVMNFISSVGNPDRLPAMERLAASVGEISFRDNIYKGIAMHYAESENYADALRVFTKIERRGTILAGLLDIVGEMAGSESD